jgi:hypothetical protein
MSTEQATRLQRAFETVRRYGRHESRAEHCALCGLRLSDVHPHLLELPARKLICSCDACAVLVSARRDLKHKAIRRHVVYLEGFEMTDAQWDSLLIPIGLAFFFRSSESNRVGCIYPGPSGATESLLPLEFWDEIVQRNQTLAGMEPDVEALLVNRLGAVRGFEANLCYLLPIDQCYRLVGLMRTHWRGLSGGDEVWERLQDFFGELHERANAQKQGVVHA